MGDRGIRTGIYAVILVSIALLFLPAQQGYGSTDTLELNEHQLLQLYKSEQSVKAEQARDEIFVLRTQQNPYLDTPLNDKISFKENDETHASKSIIRENKNFQLIKDEQISIAEKKSKEILGGKIILNSITYELDNNKSIDNFKIENQANIIKRNSDDFQNYRLLQISKAEDTIDNNWKEFHWNLNPYQNDESKLLDESIPYQNDESKLLDESILPSSSFLPNQILTFRHTLDNSEIKVKVQTEKVHLLLDGVSTIKFSLVNQVGVTDDIGVISPSKAIKRMFAMSMFSNNEKSQILNIPSKTQNEKSQILNIPSKTQNEKSQILNMDPKRDSKEFNNLILKQISLAENTRNESAEFGTSDYSNPYLNENFDESLDKTKNDITRNLTDLTFGISELELTRLDRENKEFEMAKALELEIAQNTLNEIVLLTNSDKDEIKNIILSNENGKLSDIERDDDGFEILKNKQIEIAEKKLLELYGH